MNITKKLLRVNEFSRPGKKLAEKKALILHWVGVGGQRALTVWEYFEYACVKEQKYASAHYCVDLDGGVYQFIPDDEVAYHCGSSQNDPKSGKIYTDWARDVFGKYAEDPKGNSPNNASIGIELCVIDNQGNFAPETLQSAAELTARLCQTWRIPLERVGTHNMVVGWKDCPRLWTRFPDQFSAFKERVGNLMTR
ncbi:MAG: peptidoglycan recognition protein family protein [Treponema sp.]|jgi:N-acetylmuramoyl-L-alanine amidase|nr:peptidoglycan recognition protein family protein [Treponema sp.]